MASAPLKMTGGVTQLVGLDQALPIFGKKKQMGPREAGAVDFYAGAGDAASDSAALTLRQLIEHMRRDKTLEVTLRHDLGGGDIARAAQRANPSPETAAALGESLRQRRAWLKQQRDQLAPAVKAMIVAGSASSAADAITQLRGLEAQLAATEDGLDRAFDLTRAESYRQAERRTRAASLEIAEARLEAVKRMIVAARIPDALNRVRIVKPQFALADGDEGGTISMVVVSKKKP
jgi:hypothetical protein